MSVGREQARRIATLARLHFGEAELSRVTEELNHILDHMETLRALEKRGAHSKEEPRASTRGSGAEEPDALEREIGSFAPDWRDGFFVVPPFPGVHAEDAQ